MASTRLEVEVNIDPRVLEEATKKVLQDEELNLAIHNAFARYCHPYVPYLNGPLSETVEVLPDHITYIQPYARYQYYGDGFNFTKDYHPLATSRWDEAMMRDRGADFCMEVEALVKEFAKRRASKPSLWQRIFGRFRRKK